MELPFTLKMWGGEQLEAALNAMQNHGRIVACGMVSQYNLPESENYPLRNMEQIVEKCITVCGFIVSDPEMGPKYAKEHQENVQKWIADGSIKVKLSLTKGIDHTAEGLIGMLEGENFGKAVLVIKEME
jgi:NADPH-dependent curcumin reductase CurA